jgi:outer membrane immunogenic protein
MLSGENAFASNIGAKMDFRAISVSLVFAGIASSSVFAADIYLPTEPAAAVDSVAFAWDGAYVGVEAGTLYYDADSSYSLVGLHAGVNIMAADNFLIGLEADLQYLPGDSEDYLHAVILGRVGVIVAPQVLLYAAAGVGVEHSLDYGNNYGIYEAGIGAELALNDSFTLRGQVLGLGFTESGLGFEGVKATVGVGFHF